MNYQQIIWNDIKQTCMMDVKKMIDDIEKDEHLMTYEYKGVAIWPVIRFYVLQKLIEKLCSLDSLKAGSKNESKWSIIKMIVFSITENPFFTKKRDVVFFNTSTSNIRLQDGRFFNRICDYLDQCIGFPSAMIEEPMGFLHARPRIKKEVFSKLPIFFIVDLRVSISRYFGNPFKGIEPQLNALFSELENNLKDVVKPGELDSVLKEIKTPLIRVVYKAPLYLKLYKWLLRKTCEKLVILEDGYYGLDKATLTKAAKELNLTVIEPQHGFVSSKHPAYSFGDGICKNTTLKKYFPDVFLAYGEFWKNTVKLPNKAVVIGNPHLSTFIDKYSCLPVGKKILVIGSGISVYETKDLLMRIVGNSRAEGFDIYLRPHPLEGPFIAEKYADVIEKGVFVDADDLYFSIASSEIVISELSTVLFEAVAFKKNIRLFNSKYTQTYMVDEIRYFRPFDLTSVDSIFEEQEFVQEAVDYYWNFEWKSNLQRLLESLPKWSQN